MKNIKYIISDNVKLYRGKQKLTQFVLAKKQLDFPFSAI